MMEALKLLSKLFKRVFKYFCSLIILIFLLIPFIFILPLCIYRLLVATVVIRFYPEIVKLLCGPSAGMGSDDLYNKPRCTVLCTFIADGSMDISKVRNAIKSRVVDRQDEFGKLIRPELQQYITHFWGYAALKGEPNFNIDDHVRAYKGGLINEFQDRERGFDKIKIKEISIELSAQPFDREKSPWVVYVLPNYRETSCINEPTQTAFIMKFNHGFADGMSMIKAFILDLNDEVNAEMSMQTRSTTKVPMLYRIGNALDFVFSAPYDLVRELTLAADSPSDLKLPESRLLPSWNTGLSSSMPPVNYFKDIRFRHNVSFATVIFECFTAALRKFVMEAGLKAPNAIHAVYPLPFQGHPNKMGNYFTTIYVRLPLGITNPLKRLASIEEDIKRAKQSAMPAAVYHLTPVIEIFPAKFLRSHFKNNATAVVGNMQVPMEPLTIMGHKLITGGLSGGSLNGSCGIVFVCFTMNGTLNLGVTINDGIVSQAKLSANKIVEYFLEEAQLLMALAPAAEI